MSQKKTDWRAVATAGAVFAAASFAGNAFYDAGKDIYLHLKRKKSAKKKKDKAKKNLRAV
jgi:hypothetical protein